MVSKMVPKLALILSIILVSATSIASFDITKLLQKYGDFSNFNDLLTQTGLASNINNRQTITVLVVDNSGMGSITSKPQDVAKNILATHVLLDYYDPKKLGNVASSKNQTTLITLFQTTGAAVGSQGALTASTSGSDVVVGSAVNGAPHNSKVLKSIESQPYNISVLQISQPIVTPGLDHSTAGPTSSPASTPAQSPKKGSTPAPSPNKAPSLEPSDSPATSPSTSPATSPGPDGSPASSPKGGDADDNVADKAKGILTPNEGARMSSIWGVTVLASMGLLFVWAL